MIREVRGISHGAARRQLQLDAAQGTEALPNPVHELGAGRQRLLRGGKRFLDDDTRLGLHRAAVAGGADAQLFLQRRIELADVKGSHRQGPGVKVHARIVAIGSSDVKFLHDSDV